MIMINLYNGDCIKIMNELYKNGIRVDAIICDPPYGTTQCKWDSVLPLDTMWDIIYKLRRNERTPIILNGMEPFSSVLRLSNIKHFKYDWVWDKVKGTGFLNAKRQPMRNHEFVSVFYEKQCLYQPQKTQGHKKKKSYRSKKLQTDVYGTMNNDYTYESTERYPRSIQIISTDTQNSSLHPTQKPVALAEYMIKTYTRRGDVVLDFTMGSGTVGVACKNLDRAFIGIELDEYYFKLACDRLGE